MVNGACTVGTYMVGKIPSKMSYRFGSKVIKIGQNLINVVFDFVRIRHFHNEI